MKNKIIFLLFVSLVSYSKNLAKLDKYMHKWLKKNDAVLLFNYRNGKILYEYHPYMFEKKIQIGSIFKIITTFLYLKKFKKTNYTYNCIPNKDKDLFCWNKKGHGRVNLDKAFIYSCNKFYYSLDLNVRELTETANYLGLKLNFNPDYLNSYRKKLIKAGNSHFIKANFYELSKLLSVFATSGYLMDIKTNKKYYIKEKNIIKKIRKLMELTVKYGTAQKTHYKNYNLSGKTGTAKNEFSQLIGIFTGFTTKKDYAIIVLLNNNIGAAASMIAGDVIYLYDKENHEE